MSSQGSSQPGHLHTPWPYKLWVSGRCGGDDDAARSSEQTNSQTGGKENVAHATVFTSKHEHWDQSAPHNKNRYE